MFLFYVTNNDLFEASHGAGAQSVTINVTSNGSNSHSRKTKLPHRVRQHTEFLHTTHNVLKIGSVKRNVLSLTLVFFFTDLLWFFFFCCKSIKAVFIFFYKHI